MNEIWTTKAESELLENSQGFVNNKMYYNRVVRLARGVQKREPRKATKWARTSKASGKGGLLGSFQEEE